MPGLFLLLIAAEFCWFPPVLGEQRSLQMLAKVAVYGLVGLVGLYRFRARQAVPRVMALEYGVFLGLCVWFAVTSVQSPTILKSLASSVSMLAAAVYAFSIFALAKEDLSNRAVNTIKWATGLTVLSSCILGLAAPDQFVTAKEYFETGFKFRLRGIMGHPNALGRVCAAFLLIVYYQWGTPWRSRRRQIAEGAMAGVVLLALFFTQSRTNLIGLVAIVSVDIGFTTLAGIRRTRVFRLGLVAAACCALLVVIGRAAYVDQSTNLAAKLSRRGDASEVFQLAGRVDVWSDVLILSKERPLTGYGLRAGETVLRDYHNDQDPKNQWVAIHAHNMFLEALLAGGIGAAASLILCGLLALKAAIASYKRHRQPVDRLCVAMIATVLLMGLVERGVMGVYFHFVVFVSFWLLALHRQPLQTSSGLQG